MTVQEWLHFVLEM